MLLLNPKNNNYQFRLPKSFIPDNIEKAFNPLLKNRPSVYNTLLDFINSTIQGVSVPSINHETVEQVNNVYKNRFKSAENSQITATKDFSVTFKLTEAYLNYWVLLATLTDYYSYGSEELFKPDMQIRFLDAKGNNMVEIRIKNVIFKGLSDLELNFSSNTPDFNTFTADFEYNYIDILTQC